MDFEKKILDWAEHVRTELGRQSTVTIKTPDEVADEKATTTPAAPTAPAATAPAAEPTKE